MAGRRQTLEERIKQAGPGRIISFRPEELTKEEYTSLISPTPLRKLENAFYTGSPRELALVGGSMVEAALSALLREFMVEGSGDVLFGPPGRGGGQLSAMGAKIDLAYALGLVSEAERDEMHLIREIRNPFAHDADLRIFEHNGKVLSAVKKLQPTIPPGQAAPPPSLLEALFISLLSTHHRLTARLPIAAASRRVAFTLPRPPVDDANNQSA